VGLVETTIVAMKALPHAGGAAATFQSRAESTAFQAVVLSIRVSVTPHSRVEIIAAVAEGAAVSSITDGSEHHGESPEECTDPGGDADGNRFPGADAPFGALEANDLVVGDRLYRHRHARARL
jgi:hypothetical protein